MWRGGTAWADLLRQCWGIVLDDRGNEQDMRMPRCWTPKMEHHRLTFKTTGAGEKHGSLELMEEPWQEDEERNKELERVRQAQLE